MVGKSMGGMISLELAWCALAMPCPSSDSRCCLQSSAARLALALVCARNDLAVFLLLLCSDRLAWLADFDQHARGRSAQRDSSRRLAAPAAGEALPNQQVAILTHSRLAVVLDNRQVESRGAHANQSQTEVNQQPLLPSL